MLIMLSSVLSDSVVDHVVTVCWILHSTQSSVLIYSSFWCWWFVKAVVETVTEINNMIERYLIFKKPTAENPRCFGQGTWPILD